MSKFKDVLGLVKGFVDTHKESLLTGCIVAGTALVSLLNVAQANESVKKEVANYAKQNAENKTTDEQPMSEE